METDPRGKRREQDIDTEGIIEAVKGMPIVGEGEARIPLVSTTDLRQILIEHGFPAENILFGLPTEDSEAEAEDQRPPHE